MARFVAGRLVEAIPVLLLSSLLVFAILHLVPALRRNTWVDGAVMIFSLAGVSIPSFAFAMLLILVFSVFLGMLPATGSGSFDRLILPAVVLGYEGTALIARLTRASLLEGLGREDITTARSQGRARRIVGLQVGRLLAGSIIVETVFARQGVGQLAIDAILQKDYPLVQGIILLTASAYVVANLLVDISYGFINPRIRTA